MWYDGPMSENLKNIEERIKNLRETVDDYRYRYHVKNDPEVTDVIYESLMDELRSLESKYPKFRSPNSPTQRIGGQALDEFVKVAHKQRQWSFDDLFDHDGLIKWDEKVKRFAEKAGFRARDDDNPTQGDGPGNNVGKDWIRIRSGTADSDFCRCAFLFAPQRADFGFDGGHLMAGIAGGTAPFGLFDPGTGAAKQHAQNQRRKQQDKQRNFNCKKRFGTACGVE